MSRTPQQYPAGTITVRGVEVEVFTDSDGTWIAYPTGSGSKVTAGTRAGLKAELSKALRAASLTVAVPFLAQEGKRIMRGVATGLHSGSRNVLVTWPGDRKDQVAKYDTRPFLDGDADPGRWQALIDERDRTARELREYIEAHKIKLPDAVKAALDQALAGEPEA